MDAHPVLRHYAMRAFAGSPALFRGLLDVHLGNEALPHFLLHNSIDIAMRMAFPCIDASDRQRASI
jgi:hypothetical protein